MSPEFDPEPEIGIFHRFVSTSSEDGVNRTLIRGEEKKGEINFVHFMVASLPNGNTVYMLLKEDNKDLKEYCEEILDLTAEEDSSDIRKRDNNALRQIYSEYFKNTDLPVAVLAFGLNKFGETVNIYSVVGTSAPTALNSFKDFAERILGME